MDAKQFLKEHFFCDGHADTFARIAFAGADFVTGTGTDSFHIDARRMRESGLNLQLMAVYIPPHIANHQGTVTAMWIAQFAHRVVEQLGDECQLVLTKSDLGASHCKSCLKPRYGEITPMSLPLI